MQPKKRWIVLGTFLCGLPAFAGSAEPSPAELLRKVDELWRGTQGSEAVLEMKVVTKDWSRSMKIQSWAKGSELALIRVLHPPKEAGTATLKSGKNMWNYLPNVRRVMKLPTSMMGASWMGSHFSNDDLVQGTLLERDFTYKRVELRGEEAAKYYEIELSPKPSAAVTWGKIAVRIEKEHLIPVWEKYYDEDLTLVRTLSFSDLKQFSGRWVPAKLKLTVVEKPDESTELSYQSLKLGLDLADDFFSQANLRK